MSTLLSIIFFICGLFNNGYYAIALFGISALFTIADNVYSIAKAIENKEIEITVKTKDDNHVIDDSNTEK